MSTELNNSEFLKNEIKEALDETFGPLLVQIAKMIKDMSDSIKSQDSVNEILTAKLNLMYSLQTDLQTKLINFESISQQFEKLDKNLAKFLQKSTQDTKKLQEQIGLIHKEPIKQAQLIKEESTGREIPVTYEESVYQETPNLVSNLDTEYIKDLIAEFSRKEIYTTEALKIIEETRDKLLFEREDEVPYRAYGAKIFREILAIVKSEKDFRTISPMAADDIKKHLNNLLEHI